MSVDHEARRRQIAAITVDVIAEEGLDAATVRRIAAEMRLSTTAITHYYADKRELLRWSYRSLAREALARFEEALAREPLDLVEVLMSMLPWEGDGLRRWRAYLAFWDEAARDPVLAVEHRRSNEMSFEVIARALAASDAPPADLAAASRLLNAILQGYALQMIAGAAPSSSTQIRTLLESVVARVILPGEEVVAAPVR